jgi:hypothetical protein
MKDRGFLKKKKKNLMVIGKMIVMFGFWRFYVIEIVEEIKEEGRMIEGFFLTNEV